MTSLKPIIDSLEFFEGNLPGFFAGDDIIKKLIAKLKGVLKEQQSDFLYAKHLDAGKDFMKYVIETCIKYLSDNASQPVPSNKAVENIKNFVDTFATFEELLFGLNANYRDHTMHSIWVYLFGHEWISKLGGYESIKLAGQLIIRYEKMGNSYIICPKQFIKAEAGHLQAMWGLIAFLHDLGYPVQTITNKAHEVFGKILEPFAIDFSAIFQTDLSSRISFLHQPLCDLLATVYRPKILTEEEEDRYYREAEEETKRAGQPVTKIYPVKPIIGRDEAPEIEFRIATANKAHSAWSAILAFKNIDYLHLSEYRGGGDIDYLKLLTRRDILESIVHHTSEEPKDDAVNRFQFILLLLDDIEEALRYGRGGQERGNVSTECDLKWEANEKQTQILLDFTEYDKKMKELKLDDKYESKAKRKYEEISKKYKKQLYREKDDEKYIIEIQVKGQEFNESLVLSLELDPPTVL